ncbi:MAG TPA: hypothetical protein PK379_07815 [Candidatus Hydrogenedentes bacterium]|nr:hypothetical protein [Candidatus Hydrogenedentota bacterium]
MIAAVLLLLGGWIFAEVPVTGTGQKVSVQDLAGTDTLVTVVLKDSGAQDKNLKVLAVNPATITFLNTSNLEVVYLLDNIAEIQIQEGKVETRQSLAETQVLRAEQQRVVDRAMARVREIFDGANDDQNLKLAAAALLALNRDEGASDYLKKLAETNDVMAQLRASRALYLAGDEISRDLLRQGLESGNREAQALAAELCGLAGVADFEPLLFRMFQDRAVELSAPATRALARLGNREIIPRLLVMITEPNEEKGRAAVFALSTLGGEDVIDQMHMLLPSYDGIVRLRIVMVLYWLKTPDAVSELKKILSTYPTLAPDVALVLAREGDWEATQFLRNRLQRREDPTDSNLVYRAKNAGALFANGDPTTMAVFQEVLRSESLVARKAVFDVFLELGSVRLISLLQPSIENVDREIALAAATTVVGLANPEFRKRWQALNPKVGF